MPMLWKATVVLGRVLLFTIFFPQPSGAWDATVTHPELSERAANASVLKRGILRQLGLLEERTTRIIDPSGNIIVRVDRAPAIERIRDGAKFEDAGNLFTGRFYNHFHNPLRPSNLAGLDTLFFSGQSSLLWAQDTVTNPDWSWRTIRQAYYDALTTTGGDREARFGQAFEGVGHLIHLVQDMAQPAHVRNDAHPLDGLGYAEGLETWAASNPGPITTFARSPMFPTLALDTSDNGLAPITQFWDRDLYDGTAATHTVTEGLTVGLAEHTNANFFSEDTILSAEFSSGYPFPSTNPANYSICEDGSPAGSLALRQTYLSRTPCASGPDPVAAIDRFAAISPLEDPDQPLMTLNPELRLDNRVRQDYARHLIPRAVGYSAALIDYFFRNDIEITPPDRFVYGITQADGAFTEIRLKARNITSTGEPLSGGTIKLVLTYRQALEDPYRANLSGPVPTSPQATTIVVPEANGLTNIPSDTPVELVFDLTNTPLPRLITDLYAQVVYRGTWGTEPDAVVVGYKDLSEPTPIDIVNMMDRVCLNGQYLVAGTAAAVAAADLNGNGQIDEASLPQGGDPGSPGEPDPYPHGLAEVFLRFSSIQAPQSASSTTHHVVFPAINPAQHGRVFLLAEPEFWLSSLIRFVTLDDGDPTRDHGGNAFAIPASAIKNQTDVVDGRVVQVFSQLSDVRGVPFWFGAMYRNAQFPPGTACAEQVIRAADPDISGPVPAELR